MSGKSPPSLQEVREKPNVRKAKTSKNPRRQKKHRPPGTNCAGRPHEQLMVADVRMSAMMSLIGLDLPVAARVGATNLRALLLGEPDAVIGRLGRIEFGEARPAPYQSGQLPALRASRKPVRQVPRCRKEPLKHAESRHSFGCS